MFKHILLPTDGSELSESAIKTGVHLAKALGAKVTGLTVIPKHHHSGEEELEGESGTPTSLNSHLLFVKLVASGNGVDCDAMLTRGDSPSEEIMRVAGELRCDLIVMASHSRKSLKALFIGSETQKVLVHSHVPVLVCR
ncbi:universal stress protein [Rhodanobacter glycinis]|uniref:universal stress protein n=1 Tax=Rhodanobacter glycinis TaxID=582702 RepID=UPI00112B3A56|nr:universal stress protein [Rhodanobacter glycinis]TPG50867.1 universal stress protein [Rhodanobacter glycinis]